ncbi:MAG: 3-oxoacyl-ACP reductase family protein [Cyanobacteriota bacterium]|mgnify:CR=1 FL=1
MNLKLETQKTELPKIIIITGGSRGIGKAIVKQFANSENKVYFTYKNSEKEAKEIEQELSNYNVFSYKLDISVSEDIKTFIEYVFKKENKIDILINNAGITDDSLFLSMSDEKWLNVINTNLNGTFFITKETAKYMMRKKQGKIINISSIVASKGNAGQTNYSASKAGIEGMTRSFALELASRGITVNSISLGFVLTDMTKKILENSEKILSHIPLNRFCEPEEVAEFIYLFSGLKSNYITGQTINIDGGLGLLKF